jgi:hypothetical protein
MAASRDRRNIRFYNGSMCDAGLVAVCVTLKETLLIHPIQNDVR